MNNSAFIQTAICINICAVPILLTTSVIYVYKLGAIFESVLTKVSYASRNNNTFETRATAEEIIRDLCNIAGKFDLLK